MTKDRQESSAAAEQAPMNSNEMIEDRQEEDVSARAATPQEQEDGQDGEAARAAKAGEDKDRSTETITVEGQLHYLLGRKVRLIFLLTGLAALHWLVRGIRYALGYRYQAKLSLSPRSLDLRGQRLYLGLTLPSSRLVIPISAVQRVNIAGRSPWWSLIAALAALVAFTGVGTMLILWAIVGHQLSWAVWGLLIIGGGVLLDALAYLHLRHRQRRSLVDLEIWSATTRLVLSRVRQKDGETLIDQLEKRVA